MSVFFLGFCPPAVSFTVKKKLNCHHFHAKSLYHNGPSILITYTLLPIANITPNIVMITIITVATIGVKRLYWYQTHGEVHNHDIRRNYAIQCPDFVHYLRVHVGFSIPSVSRIHLPYLALHQPSFSFVITQSLH